MIVFKRMSEMETRKENISYILYIVFDKSENESQAAENVNRVYAPVKESVNHTQFRLR